MTTLKSAPAVASSLSAMALCRLTGIACLAGFVVDTLVLGFPANPGDLAWRASFLQQVGDRSIILLFGMALLMYGFMESRAWRKRFAIVSLAIGIAFQLSCVMVIKDSSALQKQALGRIGDQATQIETRIAEARTNPELAAKLTPEQIESAAKQLSAQAATLEKNAKTGIFRAGLSSVGNLFIVGLSLLALGRYGLRPHKAR
ncbi:MAG: hypothetical protein HC771_17410 [Synechococcales cyanobacterium CRU_2_2]|nr:hypothetical protein [Synechococcales cyanobacterium CRU_2_2]